MLKEIKQKIFNINQKSKKYIFSFSIKGKNIIIFYIRSKKNNSYLQKVRINSLLELDKIINYTAYKYR